MKEDTTKHTLHFYRGDFQKVQELHPEIGASIIIRNLVRKYLRDIESQTRSADASGIRVEVTI